MKTCIRCGSSKKLDDFYAHPMMGDGRLNKCKDCCRSDASSNYERNREKYKLYERSRNQTEERRAKKREYQKTSKKRNPHKVRARSLVQSAIKCGRLSREPCQVCGAPAEAHHDDYSKPLDVKWFCFVHHREIAHGQVCNTPGG